MRRPDWATLAAMALVTAIIAGPTFYGLPHGPAAALPTPLVCAGSPGIVLGATNVTPQLPDSFSHGSVQAFGSNASSVVFGGVSYYAQHHQPFDSLPAIGVVTPSTPSGTDLTPVGGAYFDRGGVFPVVWNGSGWLLAGQTTIGGDSEGSAVSWTGDRFTNLTPEVGRYFLGEGIWIAGWDGHGWLLGGNSSRGAALVYLSGSTATDLTPLIPNNAPGDWVQMVGWNGTAWLVGGFGVFGTLSNGRFTDLLQASPFAEGGVYAIDWNGTSWLVGGSPAVVASLRGSTLGPPIPALVGASGWVNAIVALPGNGWIVAGGSYGPGRFDPFAGIVLPGTSRMIDASACLAGAFQGGWVQFGAAAPAFGDHAVLLVGEGGTDPRTYESHSAAVELRVGA
ncbi:MAG TPA: hypothetical protein VGV64_00970 [Thermoplasmata archaeon]|nr:hypothetical protein [Thermoplasmata archaeon]